MQSSFYKLLFAIFIVQHLCSCSAKPGNDLTILATLNKEMYISILNIESANQSIYRSFAGKVTERRTMDKAKIWQPRALAAKDLSDNMVNYIDVLKKEIKEQAGLKWENGKESFDNNNQSSVRIVYDKRGRELLEKLRDYRVKILEEDIELKNKFENTLPVDIRNIHSDIEFNDSYFRNTTAISALAVLSNFQLAVRNAENMIITFYHEHCSWGGCGYELGPFYMVTQSSSFVKKEAPITITAGIGVYSTEPGPTFTVAGKKIKPNEKGCAVYTFKASSKPGKHSVPVTIDYFDPNGNKASRTEQVEYEVAKDSTDEF